MMTDVALPRFPAKYARILSAIADGMTVTEACALHGIAAASFYGAKRGSPEMQEAFRTAQEIGAEAMADTLQNINERIRDPLMARVVSENRRWLLGKRGNPNLYADKVQAEQVNNDLTAILKEAIARIPRPVSDQQPAIEAENITISDIFG